VPHLSRPRFKNLPVHITLKVRDDITSATAAKQRW